MAGSVLKRIRNPCDLACGCLPTCWCRRTRLGYAIRWYTPGRWHRLRDRRADASRRVDPMTTRVPLRLVGPQHRDPLADLAAACHRADDALGEAIAAARRAGHSWSQIAAAMGLSPTVVRRRWSCTVDGP